MMRFIIGCVLFFISTSLFAQESTATIQYYESRIAENPDDADAHFSFGDFLASLDTYGYYEKAFTHLRYATQLNPHNLQWLFTFGSFCCRIGRLQESLDAYRKILQHNPRLMSVLYNAAFALKTAGDYRSAIDLYKQILSTNPDYTPAHLGLAFSYLAIGEYAQGWKEHLWNIQEQGKDSPELRTFLSQGTVAEKRILLVPEGGLGDTLQFIRYAQRLYHMGARLTVAVQKPLVPLLSRCDYFDLLIPLGSPSSSYDAKATLMSLPAFFQDNEQSIPHNIPYIFPDRERITYWRERLAHDSNIKIGICWQPDTHNDESRLPIARRGIPLSFFYTLGSMPGVSLYSLQKKEGLDQLSSVPENVTIHTFDGDFDETYGSFMDTAAVMHSLDLIITTDTAIAHLAGAMGRKTWLLLPFNSDWRWFAHRSDSPWYPTMHIFQQEKPFDWKSVMNNLHTLFLTQFKDE